MFTAQGVCVYMLMEYTFTTEGSILEDENWFIAITS